MRAGAPLVALALACGAALSSATALAVAPVTQPTHVRVLPLKGGRNFRDLGGYATADGRHVRWGLLYRSGSMAGLTASDYTYLDRLGIAVVCDLRQAGERTAEPTVWPGDRKPDYWTSDSLGRSAAASVPGALATGPRAHAMMVAVYRDLPQTHLEAYRVIFHDLADGRVPLAFNCSAGKDRSGVAAALILTALGVPRATVVADYTLSDKVLDAAAMQTSPATTSLAKMPPDVFAAVMRSDPAYIDAALAEVDRRYGGIEGYLRALGLSGGDIARMKTRLLE